MLSFIVDCVSPGVDTSQMQSAGILHISVELDRHSLLQDDLHMVIICHRAIPINQRLEESVTANTLDLE